ncbi:hypothetical protein A2917_00555 [Candidatus Nomurabacteria bacterium RIFCSPLOWO2_01_FULL_42_17]|uniref:Shikimate kinase n=1 Tax=Candidatus Nomurabacteria bacterium RIFCSPLOWO2_01_FULL_42_17 TaxID=1801780 RepID=A0A1F6XNR5_9BACT|nr:MAG: hypothetical protein A2917_00555 [Candidatus Nomurabacteria bacterium RIFCSPLOWO2_01_FULL_42_17]
MKIYITGVSGVGKSSVAEMLNKRGIYSIDIDGVEGLCHWINNDTLEKSGWHSGMDSGWFEKHEYICDKEKLINLMSDQKDTVVVCGQAYNYSDLWNLFDKVFLLHCSEEIFIKRITERTSHDFGKHNSEKEMILGWYKDFEKDILNKGAISINTDRPLADVVDEIVSKF